MAAHRRPVCVPRFALERRRDQETLDRKTREHLALVEFIAAGDSEGAAEVMRDHIDLEQARITDVPVLTRRGEHR